MLTNTYIDAKTKNWTNYYKYQLKKYALEVFKKCSLSERKKINKELMLVSPEMAIEIFKHLIKKAAGKQFTNKIDSGRDRY